jgi:hypothetical protein
LAKGRHETFIACKFWHGLVALVETLQLADIPWERFFLYILDFFLLKLPLLLGARQSVDRSSRFLFYGEKFEPGLAFGAISAACLIAYFDHEGPSCTVVFDEARLV